MNLKDFLDKLAQTQGQLSVASGIVTFEDGDTFDTAELASPHFVLVQEGGSSSELYVHGHESAENAQADREDCSSSGAYQTTPAIEVPGSLASHPDFYAVLEEVLGSLSELECVDVPEEVEEDA